MGWTTSDRSAAGSRPGKRPVPGDGMRWLRPCLLLVLIPILLVAYQFVDWLPPQGRHVAISPDGTLVASIYSSRRPGHFDCLDVRFLKNGGRLMIEKTPNRVTSFAFGPQSNLLAVGHLDGAINIWDLVARKRRATFRETTLAVSQLAYSDAGDTLLADCGGSAILLLDAATGKTIGEFPVRLRNSSFSPRGHRLSGKARENILVYELKGQQLDNTAVLRRGSVPIAWAHAGSRLAVTRGATIQVWDLDEERIVGRIDLRTLFSAKVHNLSLSPDGRTLAAVHMVPGIVVNSGQRFQILVGREVALWDVERGMQLQSMASRSRIVQTTFGPAGRFLAGITRDGNTKIWDVATGELHRVSSSHGGVVTSLWGLLAAFVGWCVAWLWSGTRFRSHWAHPIWDVGLISGLVVTALVLRITSYREQSTTAIMYGALGSLVCMGTSVVMLGRLRWSLRVPAALVAIALVWAISRVLDGWYSTGLSLNLTGSLIGFSCWLPLLAALHYFGVRLVISDGSCQARPHLPASQFPLKDVLVSMGAAGIFLAFARGVSPRDVPPGVLTFLLIVVGSAIVTALSGLCAALGKRPAVYIPLAFAIAVAAGWFPAWAFEQPTATWRPWPSAPWWFLCFQLTMQTLIVGSSLWFRMHHYRLVRELRTEN